MQLERSLRNHQLKCLEWEIPYKDGRTSGVRISRDRNREDERPQFSKVNSGLEDCRCSAVLEMKSDSFQIHSAAGFRVQEQ